MSNPLEPSGFEFAAPSPEQGPVSAQLGEVDTPEHKSTPSGQRNELPPPIIDISEEDKTKLLIWLDQWLNDLESSQADKQDQWADEESAYRALTPDSLSFEPFEGACRDIIPVGAMAVDPIHARLDIGVFKQDPVFTFKGLTKDILPLVPSIQAFADKYQKNYLKLRRVASQRILECVKLGTMVFKTVYEREEHDALKYDENWKVEEARELRFAGPKVYGIHIGDLLFPPFYESIQDCPIVFERQRTTYEALKNLESAGKITSVESLRNQQTIGIRTRVEDAREKASKHALRTTFSNEITVYEVWCDFMIKGVIRHLVITYHKETRTLLQCRLNWYFHQSKPYTLIPYMVANDSLYGIGIMEMTQPFQDAITKWHRMAQDNAYIANIRMFIAKKNSGIEQVPRIYAGRCFFVDDPSKDFIPFQAGEIYPSTLQERQNLFGMVEKRTGVSDYLTGRESPVIGTRATATSTLALLKEGTQRVEEVLENVRQGFSEVMMYCISIWIQYGTGGLEDLLFGGDQIAADVKKFFGQINQLNVNGAIAVDLTVTDAASNRQSQQQMALALIQIMMQYLEKLLQAGQGALQAVQQGIPQYAEMIKEVMSAARMMFRDLAVKYDVRNPDDYLPDLERYIDAALGAAQGQGQPGGAEGQSGGSEGQSGVSPGYGPARLPAVPSPAVAGGGGDLARRLSVSRSG